ncbi:GntR family transcriptional regulator [Methylobacterium nigriterrae]|uniref:GntR family transcriptional regulator n=1 Tax=Methylobacterium nigriterrae TaxID=3127512 RepID=UPI0030138ACA
MGAAQRAPKAGLRILAYEALKAAIAEMDIYGRPDEVRLDESKLSRDLGMSRTPVREAFVVLEHEGLIRSEARRGVFVVKKTKVEAVGIMHAWAALASMAARLACECATDDELASLRGSFLDVCSESSAECNADRTDASLRFHLAIIALSRCETIQRLSSTVLVHVKGIHQVILKPTARRARAFKDSSRIVEALQGRDAVAAGQLVIAYGLEIAAHIHLHNEFLD